MNLTNQQYDCLEMEWEHLLSLTPDKFPYRSFDNYYDVKKYLLTELIDKNFKRNIALKYCYMPEDKNESEVYILARLQMWCHQKLLAQLGGIKHFYKFIIMYEEEYGHESAFNYYHEIRQQMLEVYKNSNKDPYSKIFYYIPKNYPTKEKWTIDVSILNMDSVEELKQKISCPVCLEDIPPLQSITTNCHHAFCKTCICQHVDNYFKKQIPPCPMCRTDIHQFTIKDVELYDQLQEKYNV